jgi:hypothetical protein
MKRTSTTKENIFADKSHVQHSSQCGQQAQAKVVHSHYLRRKMEIWEKEKEKNKRAPGDSSASGKYGKFY